MMDVNQPNFLVVNKSNFQVKKQQIQTSTLWKLTYASKDLYCITLTEKFLIL